MQHFVDTTNNQIWAFDDDVIVNIEESHYVFYSPHGEKLNVPNTLSTIDPPAIDHVLNAQNIKLAELLNAYNFYIQQPVNFMNRQFQADFDSQSTLNKVITASGGTLPENFYWVDILNNKVPFTYDDLKNLSAAMLLQGWTAFQKLQDKKTLVKGLNSIDEINQVGWS